MMPFVVAMVPCTIAVMVEIVALVKATITRKPCQVCGKTGHGALCCNKRFDANYNGEDKYENAATTRYNVDTEWYTDTSATDHITSELDKLTTREKYGGADQLHTASG
jgi:hypothetical protein